VLIIGLAAWWILAISCCCLFAWPYILALTEGNLVVFVTGQNVRQATMP